MLEQGHNDLSMRQQCQLLGISRSNLYYNASSSFSGDLQLMKYIGTPRQVRKVQLVEIQSM